MIIFVTPVPSFYKINLFNGIAEKEDIFVVYTGKGNEGRNEDFFKGKMNFPCLFLSGNTLWKTVALLKSIYRIKYDRLILSGWDILPSFVAAFASPKKQNGCIVESSIYESTVHGMKGLLKRLYLSRINTVYASGKTQVALVQALGYKGNIKVFGGCGILNYVDQPIYEPRSEVKNFLYVGRLSGEKNLELLIQTFNELPNLVLNIIGFGPLEKDLKSISKSNIHFLGAIDNAALSPFYQESDVFILPSKSEPWGLVVEEALNNGTPVIVSDRVGCKDDLVSNETGVVFPLESGVEGLRTAVIKMQNVDFYNTLRRGVSKLNFKERASQQVRSFLE